MSCPDCTKGALLPGEPRGTFSTQGAYFSGAPSGTGSSTKSKRAIILLTDGFGLPLKNCKIIADDLAIELGCDVWVPDYFEGKPLIPLDFLVAPDRAGVKMSLLDWAKFILGALRNLPAFIKSRPSVVDGRIARFIAAIQDQNKYDKIGIVGYCYGGSAAIRLGSKGLVHSLVICHPGGYSIDEVKAIRVPSAWACPEEDIFVTGKQRRKAESTLAARTGKQHSVEYEFKDYKGTAHGFAARPNLGVPEVKEAYEQAFRQTVDWFQKTLSV